MPAQLPGLLHIVANLKDINEAVFNFLLDEYMCHPPQHDDDGPTAVIREGENAQQVLMLELLKTCLMRRHADCVRRLVELLNAVEWAVKPGRLSLLLCQPCKPCKPLSAQSIAKLRLPLLVPEVLCTRLTL